MAQHITVSPDKLTELRRVDERLVSYNIEMTEITGGTFWKPYTPEQVAGTEPFPPIESFTEIQTLMSMYEPIDLYNERLRAFAKGLGPVWVRVSGSWASSTYYDFDGHTGGKVPEGFQSILTKAQWIGLLDFVTHVGAKLLISVANTDGVHPGGGAWDSAQAKLLFDFSRSYGVSIDAAEFMNEPNVSTLGGAPKGYTSADFGRDQDLFFRFVRENYPEVQLVGPCACGSANGDENTMGVKIPFLSTTELLDNCKENADIFSYHYYNGLSERGAIMGGHWDVKDATTDPYLEVAAKTCRSYIPIRDKYCTGAPMWVTESGDAGCGGNTWGSTYLDVLRYANELASFASLTDGVIFHNTLCSSDYGLLAHGCYDPRPNYWLAVLWNKLIGPVVYDTAVPACEGAHLYAHSRKDGKPGFVYVLINNSTTETTQITLPACERYTLSADTLRAREMQLNGTPLRPEGSHGIPALNAVCEQPGTLEAAPATVSFFVV